MYLKHKIFAGIFNLFADSNVNDNLISFITDSNQSFSSNFKYIRDEFEKNGDYEFNYYYKDKFSLKSLKKLAGSKYVFLNDNFFPLAFMNFNEKTCIIQLWHAPGAFKKFGASVESGEILSLISDNTDYLITSSENINKHYHEAFQIDECKIKALGIPRLDYYFKKHDILKMKNEFCEKYNISNDKKIILYAPTFRNTGKYNNVFSYFDLKEFNRLEDYVLVLRLHPKIRDFYSDNITSNESYVDCSDFENEQELLLIADMLITDYSSIMVEYALLFKPIIFYPYDFDEYDRGFYLDYNNDLPGVIANDMNQLIGFIENPENTDNSKFIESQFDYVDGDSSKRIVNFILNGGLDED